MMFWGKPTSLVKELVSKPALFLFALSIISRLGWVIYLHQGRHELGIDESEYFAIAHSIRFHGVFSFGAPHHWASAPPLDGNGPFTPTAARSPLYPLLIAALWWSTAPPIWAVEITHVVLGTITCLLTYSIAKKVSDHRTALIAGTATALWPLTSYMTGSLLSETLFTFLMMSGLWLWSMQRGWAAGVMFGAAALTRPIVLPFVVLIGLCALIFKFNRATHIKLALGALLLIAPWTVRNIATQRSLIPIQTQGWGANLLLGTIDAPYRGETPWISYNSDPDVKSAIASSTNETEAERKMLRAAIVRIRNNPFGWVAIRIKQYPRLFADTGMYIVPFVPLPAKVIKIVVLWGTFFLTAMAGLGMALSLKRWRQRYFLAAFPLFMCLIQIPAYGEARFIVPIIPMLAIFGAIALCSVGVPPAASFAVPAAIQLGRIAKDQRVSSR